MASTAEVNAMRRAIALSAFGLGTTSPNPPVGCVILDAEGRVVGEGFHERKGEPHAEGHALRRAGGLARGGTAVVTLEPCNHVGRTPACRQLLLDAGIARVVIAVLDPTSRGAGGAQVLRDHGVSVEVGVLTAEAELVLGPWLTALGSGRPHVTWACCLGPDGVPRPPTDALVRELRHEVDVVLLPDLTLVEGVPGGHGPGVLAIPDRATPASLMTDLAAGGVRSLLLAVDDPASVLLQDGPDRVVVTLDAADRLDTAPGLTAFDAALEIVAVRRHGDGVLVDLRKQGR